MRSKIDPAETFDTNAAGYEKMRPGYPDALYRDIFRFCPLGAHSRALEIGIGAGQAAPPILRTGCHLTAVERGQNFSALCRRKFSGFPRFSVVHTKFEDYAAPPESFDLVYSASAFHWIPEALGYTKVFSLLKRGGAFARFAVHPGCQEGQQALWEDIQRLYSVYLPGSAAPAEYSAEQAKQRAEIALQYGFSCARFRLYHRTRSLTAQEYTALLGTYSDHIALEEKVRSAFFREIEHVICAHGGQILLHDTIDLQLARKPSPAALR